jgi:amino acid transporter
MASTVERVQTDEELLAELGYKQRLDRAWSSFSNFAISFTIISVLAGCFTTYGIAWNNGGPIAISWGWPIICGLILLVATSMSELVSKYPTAGGIYWWSSTLGNRVWGWFTGWFNLIGLVGIIASVVYASAQFAYALLNLYGLDLGFINFADSKHVLSETFALFALFLLIHTLINIFQSHLLAVLNNISVGWHLLGVAVIIAVLIIVPDHHQSASFVFGHKINSSGFFGGSTHRFWFWFYVLPLGFLLTMYTQTGYDASAHISEETKGAALGAARGVWRSVFWAGAVGWVVLLAITFAASKTSFINSANNGFGAGSSLAVIASAMSTGWAKLVILIATIGQLFCGMSCVTAASRMCFAFSRDRAMPGWQLWSRVNKRHVPIWAVISMSAAGLIITLPALVGDSNNYTYAFAAVVSITVIGLYIAYVIPVFLRWRMGDAFQPGPWTLGRKYKWVNPAAIVWVIICVIIFSLPQVPAGVPWNKGFDWKYVNYAPLTVIAVLLFTGLWWMIDARKRFNGPIREVEEAVAAPFVAGAEAAPGTAPARPTGS